MTFYEWLNHWIETTKPRRDMWGPFAYWMGNYFHYREPPEAGWDDFNVVAACLGLQIGDVRRFMLAEVHMLFERHVTPDEFKRIEAENPPWKGTTHGCSSWLSSVCVCQGECSCHWKQTVVSEDGPLIGVEDLKGGH